MTVPPSWSPSSDRRGIECRVSSDIGHHRDHIEMSGREVSALVRWTFEGHVDVNVIFPRIMTDPKHVRGYLKVCIGRKTVPRVLVIGEQALNFDALALKRVRFDGVLTMEYEGYHAQQLLRVTRLLYPSGSEAQFFDVWRFTVPEGETGSLIVKGERKSRTLLMRNDQTAREALVEVMAGIDGNSASNTTISLCGAGSFSFSVTTNLTKSNGVCLLSGLQSRLALVASSSSSLRLQTPSAKLDTMFHLCKIRATESVFRCPAFDLIHSPGGEQYYCGVWMNDQAEYALPIFPLFGDAMLRRTACNSYQALVDHFPFDVSQPLPYSVEISGGYIGRIDRGDAGMFAYGLSLFLLYHARRKDIQRWISPLKFVCERIMHTIRAPRHIVETQTDEMEGRYPTGTANFSANCLAILGLEAAALLDRCLHEENTQWAAFLTANVQRLRNAVEGYFRNPRFRHDNNEPPYVYYEAAQEARSWICLSALASLKFGKQTISYLLSPESKLWSLDEGLRVAESATDVWDRQTLYALRCGFLTRDVNTLSRLLEYTQSRLLGSHVCYPVEEQTHGYHLSAESALYCRVIIEGLLGLRPATQPPYKLQACELWPVLPEGWPKWSLNGIFVAQMCIDVQVAASALGIQLTITWNRNLTNALKSVVTAHVDDGYRIEYNSVTLIRHKEACS